MTGKTISWHREKKHSPKSAYAKDQAAGVKVPCDVMGCKSKTVSVIEHPNPPHPQRLNPKTGETKKGRHCP